MVTEYRVEKLKDVLAGLKRKGYKSYASIEREFGVSASYLSQIINGTVQFGELAARNIEEKLKLPTFLLDRDDVFIDSNSDLMNIENTRDYENFHIDYLIRIHNKDDMKITVHTACKVDIDNNFEFVGSERETEMPSKFFSKHDVKPSCFKLVVSDSDSMKPYIHKGDEVGIDISRPDIVDGEVYLLAFSGGTMIAQVFREANRSLRLYSYNKDYPDRVVSMDDIDSNLKVIGKVIYRAG